MPIYVPKKIIPVRPTTESPLLFLAGPIRGGGDWQSLMAERILESAPTAHIACPARWSRQHRLAHHLHRPFARAENRQLIWERHYLRQAGIEKGTAGCVIFWLGCEDPESPHPGPAPYAMDTRREIGKFTAYAEMSEVRLAVGGEPGFHGLDVILFELRAALTANFPFFTSMRAVAQHALSVARK
jgi:hypothetical protein